MGDSRTSGTCNSDTHVPLFPKKMAADEISQSELIGGCNASAIRGGLPVPLQPDFPASVGDIVRRTARYVRAAGADH